MRIFNEYRQTTDSYVYNKLHKTVHAYCDYCKWHGHHSENDAWKYYYVYLESYKSPKSHGKKELNKGAGRFPSWKLASKNRKQWMKKPCILKKTFSGYDQRYNISAEIEFPMRIRPK